MVRFTRIMMNRRRKEQANQHIWIWHCDNLSSPLLISREHKFLPTASGHPPIREDIILANFQLAYISGEIADREESSIYNY
jgi:hypothetical protein